MNNIFNTKQFTWDLSCLRYIAEASDLQLRAGQVLQDFMLQHNETVMGFVLDWTKRDEEGEVLLWSYRVTEETKSKYPSMRAVKVIILND